MSTTFTFKVDAPEGSASQGDKINLFPRLEGGKVNLERRMGAAVEADIYSLVLGVSPAQIGPGQSASLSIRALRNNMGMEEVEVFLSASDENIGAVPTSVFLDSTGNAIIAVIGAQAGETTINGYFLIDDRVIASNSVTLKVATISAPVDYEATGAGQLELTIETALANALTPRIQWLSHADQNQRHPDDTGLRMLLWYEQSPQIIFIPKSMAAR